MADPTQADDTAAETTETTETPATPVTPTDGDTAVTTEGEATDQGDVEEYGEFTMPEGMELDQELLGKATPLFKELNLTKDQAQKLVDLKAQEVQSQLEAHNTRVQEWTDAVKNDKELGGENFDKSIGIAKLGIDKVGSPALKELLETYGLGSHPELVRAFYKVGKLAQEDNPESGARASDSKKSIVDRLYPTTKGE